MKVVSTDGLTKLIQLIKGTFIANTDTVSVSETTLATVATSGSYSDLSDKPTIPTVNNATLTIQKNGTTVKTFTANASSNVTANITVPTNTNELTNGAGFITGITSSDVTTALGYTPYNSTNPNGYTSNTGTVTSVNNVSPVSGNVTLSIPTVDQTYSASSANAQSGVAINGAGFLKNTATGSNAVTILGTATTSGSAVNIGYGSSASAGGAVAIGRISSASGSYSTAVGYSAKASANYAIQLGYGTNSTASSLAVGFNNTNYQLLDGTTGKIPTDRLNVVTSVSSSSTNAQIPSAKLFYDTCGDIETLINAL